MYQSLIQMGRHSRSNILYPELSYLLAGISFAVHNELGRFAREKQYGDRIEQKLRQAGIPYIRERAIPGTGNIADFFVDGKIILELKATRLLEKIDFYQTQRYLQAADVRLGLLLNFRNRYLKPVRIVKIETDARRRFV